MSLDGKVTAIELELTVKSSQRYRAILTSYLTSTHLDEVLI